MSRPIKFRVWSNEKDLYVLTNEGLVSRPNGAYVTPSRIELNGEGELYDIYGKDLVYEQFTGLLDKNEKEIYEGDIVENEFHRRAIIKWSIGEWVVDPINPPNSFTYGTIIGQMRSGNVTVIGNIHENQDLLK